MNGANTLAHWPAAAGGLDPLSNLYDKKCRLLASHTKRSQFNSSKMPSLKLGVGHASDATYRISSFYRIRDMLAKCQLGFPDAAYARAREGGEPVRVRSANISMQIFLLANSLSDVCRGLKTASGIAWKCVHRRRRRRPGFYRVNPQ